ncbi:MAG: low temperature requirement protein, partial [Thermoleophilia bacterium]|nr:low temperature requirement protein [Thermoleophilia bacterium]
AARREDDARVSTLELFFDLVFVLALTQCTAFMANDPTFGGIARGVVVLALMWWSWVGYAWLTSAVDPERLTVRLPVFSAMAAFLVASLCIPTLASGSAWIFVGSYSVVRVAQIVLFAAGSRDDPNQHRSVMFLAGSTAVGLGVLAVGATFDDHTRFAVWALAVLFDMAGPLFLGADGWKISPGHFAERHGLILLIALGESIVAIGVGAGSDVDAGVVVAAVLGMVVAACMWWVYFDVLAHSAERRLREATKGRHQNELARDGYSFLHFPMVAGVVMVALGMKKTLAHVEDPLKLETGFALLVGAGVYLLGRACFGRRLMGAWSWDTVAAPFVLFALVPAAPHMPALAMLAILAGLLVLVVLYKLRHYAARRSVVREHALTPH